MQFRTLFAAFAGLIVMQSCSGENPQPGGSGFIEATETVVSAEAAGRIETVYVEEGRAVNAGDRLAALDTLATALRLRQAEAAKRAVEQQVTSASLRIEQSAQELDLAGKEYKRVSKLIESGSVNRQLFDQTETRYRQAGLSKKQAVSACESAKAELARIESERALLEKQLRDCYPAAPVSGIVSEKYAEAGEWVGVGKPLVKIARLDTVWVKVYLPPADLTRISLGGRASVDPEDGRGQPVEGTIRWISPEAEFTPKNVQTKDARADLVYAVKITIPNGEGIFKVGMPVSVTVR
ncbi:MAG: HlyD family efflux transporter periplasmic adaptor subunit [Chitinivibrionia bacterium]|nr:HlyD family efflux transporter periplasmic adaptor subunit [Chitinivibrionia bacterium]